MFQFRLRSLLFGMLLVAIGLALLGRQVHEARRQRALVASLMEQGANIEFRSETGSLPEWLDTGYGSRVKSVGLDESEVSDLEPLAGLKNLKGLSLSGTRVSDVSSLAGLKKLEGLSLSGTQVSDLAPLAGLKNLKSLLLYVTLVSDLTPLAGLKNLKFLGLFGTPVSDEEVLSLERVLPSCRVVR